MITEEQQQFWDSLTRSCSNCHWFPYTSNYKWFCNLTSCTAPGFEHFIDSCDGIKYWKPMTSEQKEYYKDYKDKI